MKKFRIIALTLLAACCAGGGVWANEAGSGPRKITVEAEGAGSSKDEAMKNAWMEGVRQAVGMFMAADTKMTDDELTEKIAAFSRGQVNDYQVLSENVDAGGIWRIKIRAEIDQDLLQENAPKGAQTVRVAVDDGAVAQVATGNEKSQSRGDVLDASKRLLDFTTCLAYSAKLEPFTDETGKKGFRMRHQLLFDLDKYNGRVQELRLLFDKTASAKRDMPYRNQEENRAILNILKTRNMPVIDEKRLDMGKVVARYRGENPFYTLPLTYLPAKVSTYCDMARFGSIADSENCDPAGGVPFYVDADSNTVAVPKDAATATVYTLPDYGQILALFERPLTLRFRTTIGEGLVGESVNSPDFKVLVGVCVESHYRRNMDDRMYRNQSRTLAMVPLFYVSPRAGAGWAPLGAANTPGIVFYQKLDMTPEDVARNKNDINAGYVLE